jgi:hypothetical protein
MNTIKKNGIVICIIFAAVFSMGISTASGGTYYSDMGYSITIPEGWTMLNRENVRNKPKIVDAAAEAAHNQEGFSGIPREIMSEVKELVVGGDVEYFYSQDRQFSISVCQEKGKIPKTGFDEKRVCSNLKDELAQRNGREINVYTCQAQMVSGRPAMKMVADDYWKGRKYIQYMVRKNGDEILLFTANSRDGDFEEMKREFEDVMGSLKIE